MAVNKTIDKAVEKAIENKIKGSVVPHNIEAEQSLLGCLLFDREIQLEVMPSLVVDDFYAESHKHIFEAMDSIYKSNNAIDLVTVCDELEKNALLNEAGGISYVTQLTNMIPSAANYKYYLDIVKRDGVLRKLIRSSQEIIADAIVSTDSDETVASAEKKLFDISTTLDTSTMVKIDSVVPQVIDKFNAINKDKNAFQGLKTGFKSLDYLLNGLHKTDLILLAARPAMGKTSFAMNIVENIAVNENKVCAVFSLEMGREQLAQRMLCSLAEVSMQDALKGKLDKDKWERLIKAQAQLNTAKIFIDDSSMVTPSEILSKCRRLKRRYGLDLVMIDYLQLMNGSKNKNQDNRQQEISEISRSMKILAKEIEVPVIALSQLSRSVESRTGHKPQLSDLRESGAIEQDADIVMFIHRPDKAASEKELAEGAVQQNVAEILVAKHRNGATAENGEIKLYFNGGCTKFMNLDDRRVEQTMAEKKAQVEKNSTEEVEGVTEVPFGEAPPEDDDFEFSVSVEEDDIF